MKKLLIFVAVMILPIMIEAQALRNIGEEFIERGFKLVGKEYIGSSDFIIRNAFKSDAAKNILKLYDDDVIERLAKLVADNPRMKELLTTNNSALKMYLMMGNTLASKNTNVVKYFSEIMNEVGEKGFKSKYKFHQSGDLLLIKGKNGKHIASIDDGIVTTKPWKGEKDLNPFLNQYKMIPNTTYKINGQSYKTLSDGRYKEISGTLTRLPKGIASRSTEMQGLSKKVKNGIPELQGGKVRTVQAGYPVYKDDGGHILARMFGGGSEMYNYLPMSKKLNRQGGQWAQMERKWQKALREGKKVDYKINPIYESGTKRPDKFHVTYEIDGKRVTELFDNNIF
jgi:hypothetical protein